MGLNCNTIIHNKRLPAFSGQNVGNLEFAPQTPWATGNRQPATGNRQPATGNRQPATGNRQPATGNHYTQAIQNHVNYLAAYTKSNQLKSLYCPVITGGIARLLLSSVRVTALQRRSFL
jgi:hypothetical protein